MGTKILRLLILVPLLLAMTAKAQSPRLDSIRVRAFRSMNFAVTGNALVTPAIANQVINQSIGTVCNDFPAIVKFDTVTVTITTEGAALASDFLAVQKVERIVGDSLRIRLYDDSLYTKGPGDTSGSKQTLNTAFSPSYYRIAGSTIALSPKYMEPTGFTCDLLIQYQAADRQLTADSMSTAIATNYIDALDWLVLSNLYALRSMYGDAGWWMAKYRGKKGITAAK
jgi:hypothetical protein